MVCGRTRQRGLGAGGLRPHIEVTVSDPGFVKGKTMSIDLPPIPDLAPFLAPQETEKKKSRGGRKAAIVIGSVLILSDGSECVVAAFDAQGNPLCHPVQK
jgi:hypothetical protein